MNVDQGCRIFIRSSRFIFRVIPIIRISICTPYNIISSHHIVDWCIMAGVPGSQLSTKFHGLAGGWNRERVYDFNKGLVGCSPWDTYIRKKSLLRPLFL